MWKDRQRIHNRSAHLCIYRTVQSRVDKNHPNLHLNGRAYCRTSNQFFVPQTKFKIGRSKAINFKILSQNFIG